MIAKTSERGFKLLFFCLPDSQVFYQVFLLYILRRAYPECIAAHLDRCVYAAGESAAQELRCMRPTCLRDSGETLATLLRWAGKGRKKGCEDTWCVINEVRDGEKKRCRREETTVRCIKRGEWYKKKKRNEGWRSARGRKDAGGERRASSAEGRRERWGGTERGMRDGDAHEGMM